MRYYLEDLNDKAIHCPEEWIAESEARYRDQIEKTAELLVERIKTRPILLVNGPSSSGKTTTAMMLCRTLEQHGVHSQVISMDNYYRSRNEYIVPKDENGVDDLESPECMDLPLLHTHLAKLVAGEEIQVPVFDFPLQRRVEETHPVRLHADEIIVIEGIHSLSDAITGGLEDKATGLYLCVESCVELPDGTVLEPEMLRFIRRAVRDSNFRAAPVETTMQQWLNVRRGEQLYIAPFQHHAVLEIDSYLPYETNILMQVLQDRIRLKGQELACLGLDSVYHAIDRFKPIAYQAYLPKETILHEFIG